MLVSQYQDFIKASDQFKDRSPSQRLDIALYGLAGEVGSVAAAIKKRLRDDKDATWQVSTEEIEEELGDALWYCFQLADLLSGNREFNILTHDIENLRAEISAEDDRAHRIKRVLTPERSTQFLDAAQKFPHDPTEITLDAYQALAFLTARTSDSTLVEVCLAVLWQLNAELLRQKLPEIERELNRTLPDRDMNDVLGEIIWHLSALAKLYGLTLSNIAKRNAQKVAARRDRDERTPLHDHNYGPAEQLPRQFEIAL